MVKQFRIPLWYYQIKNNINTKDIGYSIELCSGLVDKDLDLKDIAIEECIEELGYKGKNIGGAYVSEKNANFIINKNNATATDVRSLIKEIKEKEKKKYNIDLIVEQEFVD